MLAAGDALARVLATMHPRDRLPFLRYLTRKGQVAGDRMYLDAIEAYQAGFAQISPEPSGALQRKPELRLVAKDGRDGDAR